MNALHSLPDDLRQFIGAHTPTVPHLETLLLLWREPGPAWTATAIAARVYVSGAAAQAIVEELAAHALVVGDGEPRRYRLPAASGPIRLLPRLAAAYASQLRAVTALIHAADADRAAH